MILPLHLIGWKIKAIALGVTIVTLAWFYKHAMTREYERGVASGKQMGWADAEKQQRATWDAEWAKIKADADMLATAERQQRARGAELERARAGISRQLADTLTTIYADNAKDRANASQIASPDLIPWIRSVLEQLRTVERERSAKPADRPAAN